MNRSSYIYATTSAVLPAGTGSYEAVNGIGGIVAAETFNILTETGVVLDTQGSDRLEKEEGP